MKSATARAFQGHVKQGTAGAMRFAVSDQDGEEREVVLKPRNGALPLKALATDLLCTELAYRLRLPCPEPMLVDVPEWIAQGTRLRDSSEPMQAGETFATDSIPLGAPLTSLHRNLVDDLAPACGIGAFDTWVANIDRWNDENLMAAPSPSKLSHFKIWMIDHDRCLGGHGWTKDTLDECTDIAIAAPHPSFVDLHRKMPKQWDEWTRKIVELPEETLRDALHLIPQDWLSQADRDSARRYLIRRQGYLRAQLEGLERRLDRADRP